MEEQQSLFWGDRDAPATQERRPGRRDTRAPHPNHYNIAEDTGSAGTWRKLAKRNKDGIKSWRTSDN